MNLAKIRLRKPRRVYSFLCDDIPLQRDEDCIVQSDRGLEWGTCVLPPEPLPPEMERRFSMRVVRKVDEHDHATHRFMEEEERKAFSICQQKVRYRLMPMKLVDVEYTFDKRKVIFYFTADDRVDFRDLVRDLAHDLRTRIEMRHIQVRDEAKMVGGIGGCGRELCCSTFLNDFKPISMRMAKRQNLSLNPSKISGQCGRLLCCLAYENDQYEEFRRQARQQQLPHAPEDAPRERGRDEHEYKDEFDPRRDQRPRPPRPPQRAQAERPPREQRTRPESQGGREPRREKRRGPRPQAQDHDGGSVSE